jgi:DNA repair exonuclease SbcCD nuclease subunit
MPYAIVSDVHLHNWSPFSSITKDGLNSRLQIILDALGYACATLDMGDRLYIAGDLFHVRGHITPSVQNPTLDFFKEIRERGIVPRIIPGNHDLESKNTTQLTNAVQALEGIGCDICNSTTVYTDDKIVMIPWMESLEELRQEIKAQANSLKGKVKEYSLIIHAPLNGVIPIPDLGLSPEELAAHGFKRVFCGHYHNHKEFADGIFSVGALTHQTWSDVGTRAGFIYVDENDKLVQEATDAPQFMDYEEGYESLLQSNYVRVKLCEATEKEIVTIRESIIKEYYAAGCVVKSVPKPVGVTRSSTVNSGASIETSIEDWVKDNIKSELQKQVSAACASILQETATSE